MIASRHQRLFLSAALAALALTAPSASIEPLLAQAPAVAQPPAIDPAILAAYRWRSIGPNRGGRSIAVSGVKGRPLDAYFGAVGGGLWKTTNGGVTWTPVTDGQITSS